MRTRYAVAAAVVAVVTGALAVVSSAHARDETPTPGGYVLDDGQNHGGKSLSEVVEENSRPLTPSRLAQLKKEAAESGPIVYDPGPG
ncbi:hypothetical protein [Actinoplanes sp. NPDC020271]|uniref:hypothetical protein n=1 Tax=Actinoplanes sp. NPDC020271 TaxID=3363896 RepID=UPI003795D3DD